MQSHTNVTSTCNTAGRQETAAGVSGPEIVAGRALLPLTVAGLESFFGDVLTSLALKRRGDTADDVTLGSLITLGEERLPAVFAADLTPDS